VEAEWRTSKLIAGGKALAKYDTEAYNQMRIK